MRLISLIWSLLFKERRTERLVREAAPDALLAHLSPVLHVLQGTEIIALLPYREPLVRAAITEAKFHGNQNAVRLLALALHEYLAALTGEEDAFVSEKRILLPIPLGKRRMKERGYNQVLEVVRKTLQDGDVPIRIDPHLLHRRKETVAQTSLEKVARYQNVQGVFSVRGDTQTGRYILLDDVATTGATLTSASATLCEAGAQEVSCIALAH